MDSGGAELNTDMGDKLMGKGDNILEIGEIITIMVKENNFILMVKSLKVNFVKEKEMDMDNGKIAMGIFIKEIFLMTKRMVMDNIIGPMEKYSKANTKTILNVKV